MLKRLGIGLLTAVVGLLAWSAEPLVVIGPWSGAEAESFEAVLQAFTEKTGIPVDYRVMRRRIWPRFCLPSLEQAWLPETSFLLLGVGG